MAPRAKLGVRLKWRSVEAELELDPVLDWIARRDFGTVMDIVGAQRGLAKPRVVVTATQEAFTTSARFLFSEKVLRRGPARNRTLVMCLAAALASSRQPTRLPDLARRRLRAWYWRRLLASPHLAEGEIETEAVALRDWLDADPADFVVPASIASVSFTQTAFAAQRRPGGTAYFAAQALLLRSNPRDLRTGEPLEVVLRYEQTRSGGLDVHHVFPAAWCRRQGLDETLWDSIVNKTPMTLHTNRGPISDKSPSRYLQDLEREGIPPQRMDAFLVEHAIDPAAVRSDDFHGFFALRQQQLVALATDAMALPQAAPRASRYGTPR